MSQAEEFKCWKCGAALLPDDRFCGQCGANAKEQPEESAGKTMFMHVGTSDSAEAHPVGKLTILEPSGREGRVFNVMAGENICGRTSGGILLDDDYISPEHCVFDANENDVVARDLQSQNGIYLKVKGDVELPSGSIVRVGQQVLIYRQLKDFDTVDGFEEANATFLGSPSEGLWGKLVHITSEGKEMEHFPLDSSTLSIGREQGDISFPQDGFISGSHAKLSFKDGKCILTDLGSSNGTYLRVEEHKLANHNTLLIGQKLMRFEFS